MAVSGICCVILDDIANCLIKEILKALDRTGGVIEWLDFDFQQEKPYDRELKGLEFLDDLNIQDFKEQWAKFWPQTGNPPNWDAVGWLHDENGKELILVEAKAHVEELKSDSKAGEVSLQQIQAAFNEVKQELNVVNSGDWTKRYYQYANRVAVLYFLNKINIRSHLVFVYFTGDEMDGQYCPKSETEWEKALKELDDYIGLPPGHCLEKRIHKVFLPVSPLGID